MTETEFTNRGVVVLKLFDGKGSPIEELRIPIEDWYEKLHDVIDSSAVRRTRGIIRIEGIQHDLRGQITKRFTNTYTADGALIDYVEDDE
jgi:hypothetical protein